MFLMSWNVASLSTTLQKVDSDYGSESSKYWQEQQANQSSRYSTSPCHSFAYYLHRHGSPDIVAIQEHKIPKSQLSSRSEPFNISSLPGYESFWSCCTEPNKRGFNGVVTFCKKGTIISANSTPFSCPELDTQGRCVLTDHGDFCIFNVYAPASGGNSLTYRMKFFNALRRCMLEQRERNKKVILMGDLNIAHLGEDRHWSYRVVSVNQIIEEVQAWKGGEKGGGGDTSDSSLPQWKIDLEQAWNQILQALETLETTTITTTTTTNSNKPNSVTQKYRAKVTMHNKPILLGKNESTQEEAISQYSFPEYTYHDADLNQECKAIDSNVINIQILAELMSKVGGITWSADTVMTIASTDGLKARSSPTVAWFEKLLQEDDMVDTFRYLHPNAKGRFTCWSQQTNARFENTGVRLDYTLIDKSILQYVHQDPNENKLRCCEYNQSDSNNETAALHAATASGKFQGASIHGGGIATASHTALETQFGKIHTGMIYTPPSYSDHVAVSLLFQDSWKKHFSNDCMFKSSDAKTKKAQPHKTQQTLLSFLGKRKSSNNDDGEENKVSTAINSTSTPASAPIMANRKHLETTPQDTNRHDQDASVQHEDQSQAKSISANSNQSKSPKKRTRRLKSIFSSNQDIYRIAESLVKSKEPQNELKMDNQQIKMDIEQPKLDINTLIQQQKEDENDEVVQVHPPQHEFQTKVTQLTPSSEAIDPENDDIVMVSSNALNPTIEYPHPRHLCGVHPFSNQDNHDKFCGKCYCFVCDILASECKSWDDHCHACDKEVWAKKKRKHQIDSGKIEMIVLDDSDSDSGSVLAVDSNDDEADEDDDIDEDNNDEDGKNRNDMLFSILEETSRELSGEHDRVTRVQNHELLGHNKKRKDARITEVLMYNLDRLKNQNAASDSAESREKSQGDITIPLLKMDGDIPQLNYQPRFFMEGVRIGWPYPSIMTPQRQMALHLIRALKNSRHVVLESPTGTGKSAGILCAALSWQRYHKKTSGENVKIIYCSRTHSQVAQMVSSLKKTPYRPQMTILGSRERLCIHKDLNPRSTGSTRPKGANINLGCQIRVRNTEKFRKAIYRSFEEIYDDENPPEEVPGDGSRNIDGLYDPSFDQSMGSSNNNDGEDGDSDDNEALQLNKFRSKHFLQCSHYRMLSRHELASSVHSSLVANKKMVNCCSTGGDKTKYGTHDIEDLVNFGLQPNKLQDVAIYRDSQTAPFGITLRQQNQDELKIVNVTKAAANEGSLRVNDRLTRVNGKDVRGSSLQSVTDDIKNSGDLLIVDASRPSQKSQEVTDSEGYSSHAACPYYLSRALSKNVELIFAPYNYVLDPNIRKGMDINLKDVVCVLDEAHNIEDVLRESGSGKFTFLELCELSKLLNTYSSMQKSSSTRINESEVTPSEKEEEMHITDVAHQLLLFVEKWIQWLIDSRHKFERDGVPVGARKAIEEYRRFKTSNDKEFEVSYFGPNGKGKNGKAIGCSEVFDRVVAFTKEDAAKIAQYATTFEKKLSNDDNRHRNATDRLLSFVSCICRAFSTPEHYYISSVVSANGNMDYAAGGDEELNNRRGRQSMFQRKPSKLPQVPPPILGNPNPAPKSCSHRQCRLGNGEGFKHCTYCDGSTPRWEASIVVKLLSPHVFMKDLTTQCRTVALASGTLAPIDSLCAELDLLPESSEKPPPSTTTNTKKKEYENEESSEKDEDQEYKSPARLQVTPEPLEAKHVINLQKQLFALSIGKFPDNRKITITYNNYSRRDFIESLGDSITRIISGIPYGGVLVFLPSFSLLHKCVQIWQDCSVWDRLHQLKGKVVIEPSSSQKEFEIAKSEFNDSIQQTRNGVLLAVFRGKMSEGISFNDDYARGVICVGIPYPNRNDRTIKAKMDYNDEQRKFSERKVLHGSAWYKQQAYRAIAQAIGRCIRHAADYGTIVLLDSRHTDDGTSGYTADGVSYAHDSLPKWMKHTVKTLQTDRYYNGRSDMMVTGGWKSLSDQMNTFFSLAKVHADGVAKKQQEDFERAKINQKNASQSYSFNKDQGVWLEKENGKR